MTETEINENIATILDAKETGINTQKGYLKLRDILTAVYNTQAAHNGIWYRIFGKPSVSPEAIILHLPGSVGQYINMSEGGHYLGFHSQIKDALKTLEKLELLRSNHLVNINNAGRIYVEELRYGVSSNGKAFVNYVEKTEKS
jgi:hypothetical protein